MWNVPASANWEIRQQTPRNSIKNIKLNVSTTICLLPLSMSAPSARQRPPPQRHLSAARSIHIPIDSFIYWGWVSSIGFRFFSHRFRSFDSMAPFPQKCGNVLWRVWTTGRHLVSTSTRTPSTQHQPNHNNNNNNTHTHIYIYIYTQHWEIHHTQLIFEDKSITIMIIIMVVMIKSDSCTKWRRVVVDEKISGA